MSSIGFTNQVALLSPRKFDIKIDDLLFILLIIECIGFTIFLIITHQPSYSEIMEFFYTWKGLYSSVVGSVYSISISSYHLLLKMSHETPEDPRDMISIFTVHSMIILVITEVRSFETLLSGFSLGLIMFWVLAIISLLPGMQCYIRTHNLICGNQPGSDNDDVEIL
jgi:hypothetical protein